MARHKGRLGMIRTPSAEGNASSLGLRLKSGSTYYVSDLDTRLARALTNGAETSDFVIGDDAAGTFFPTSITKPVMEFALDVTTWSTSPYEIESSVNNRVYTLANAGGVRDFSLDTGAEVSDGTTFGMAWRENIATLRAWSAEAEAYWQDENLTVDATGGLYDLDDTPFVCTFYPEFDTVGETYGRYVGLAEVTGFSAEIPVETLIVKRIRFQGVGPLYWRADSA